MAVRCLQRNLRALKLVSRWSWWKLFCKIRPLLDVNMDNERFRTKEVGRSSSRDALRVELHS